MFTYLNAGYQVLISYVRRMGGWLLHPPFLPYMNTALYGSGMIEYWTSTSNLVTL